MNRPLLREVQISILDLTKPFDMSDWEQCIAGHCKRVLREQGKLDYSLLESVGNVIYFSMQLGLDIETGRKLFSDYLCFESHRDRLLAVSRLDALMSRKEPVSEWQGLRGKPRSRSARATPAQMPVETPAETLEAPTPLDMATIDALLRDVEETELVLA